MTIVIHLESTSWRDGCCWTEGVFCVVNIENSLSKGKTSGDDYRMIEEVLIRRFSGSIKDVIPDLLIDSGPEHVSIVENELKI